MLTGEFSEQFEQLHAAGMAAKDADNHELALATFTQADALAADHDDPLKRMHALNPAARALWSMGRYDEASDTLHTAEGLAADLDLSDERGIIVSNLGRIAAVKTVQTVPVAQQAATLRTEAVPQFREALGILDGNPHLYYRYANAHHGSVIAALAGERKLSARLVIEGLSVAFRRSAEPYDQVRTYKVNWKGLVQLAAATALIPFGNRTPVAAGLARSKLVR